MAQVCVWGPPFSVGVLHQYWTTTLFPEGTPGRELLTLAATLQVSSATCSRETNVSWLFFAYRPAFYTSAQPSGERKRAQSLLARLLADRPSLLLLLRTGSSAASLSIVFIYKLSELLEAHWEPSAPPL